MQNTQGILVIARNNKQIDYIKQAYFLAKQIKKFLNLPTSVITDSIEYLEENYTDYKDVFHNVIEVVYDKIDNADTKLLSPSENHHIKSYRDGTNVEKRLPFKNNCRAYVYDVTPYEETLLLDTDIVVLNDIWKHCFNQEHDFLIYDESYDLAGFRDYSEFSYINNVGVKFYWATAVFFRKTQVNKIFFNLASHIQENWNHYRSVFQVGENLLRNDHVFSIAIHIMNGYQDGNFANKMPGKLFYTMDKDICWEISDNEITFLLEKQQYNGEYTLCKWKQHSIHVMNKYSLNRCIDKMEL